MDSFEQPESEDIDAHFEVGKLTLGVTEVILFELVNLVEGLLECFVGEVACGLVALYDFVVEHGEVQGEAELDGVAGGRMIWLASL